MTLTDKEKVEAIRKTLELADRGFDDEPGYVELIRDIMDSKMTMAEVDEVSKITLKKNN